ncbi:uroporphyrinogen decarboxylase family protein [Candidatus Aerophobetes bacterium]|nr:uroporphyrinogen decarboxylase family protein [Candidatus Aerophobetes bacterium]
MDGKIPDRVPVELINFICACRIAGYSIKECFTDGKKLAESQIMAQEKFGHDMIHLQNGVVGIAQSLGAEVKFFDNKCPELAEPIIKNVSEFRKLKFPDFHKSGTLLAELIKAAQIISSKLGNKVFLRFDAEIGPFSVAAQIMGLENFLMQLTDPRNWGEAKQMLSFCSEINIRLAKALKSVGAHISGFGNSFVGPDVCSPSYYSHFGYPYHRYIINQLKKQKIEMVIHMCGNATPIMNFLVDTGVKAIELDHKINPEECRKITGGRATIIGNINPTLICQGTPEQVMDEAMKSITALGRRGYFILGPGCDLPYETPDESVYALIEAAK